MYSKEVLLYIIFIFNLKEKDLTCIAKTNKTNNGSYCIVLLCYSPANGSQEKAD